MKKKLVHRSISLYLLLALSFLLFSSCSSFDISNVETMAFTISVPGGTVQLSGNPIYITGTTSTTGKTSHRLLCRITCTDGAIPGGPWIDDKPIDNGSASFEISGLVEADFDYSIDQVCTTKVVEHDQLAADITVEIGEKYIENNAPVTTWGGAGVTETMTILKGGLSKIEWLTLSDESTTFFERYVQLMRFISKQPETVKILPSSFPKLWFIPYTDASYKIEVTGEFVGGESTAYTTDSYTFTGNDSKLYEFNLNTAPWTNLAAGVEGKILNKITAVISQGSDLGIGQVFEIDNNYHETTTEFYFANQLGGVDLLSCTGEMKEKPATEGESWTRPLSATATTQFATRVSQRKTITKRFTCNTGYLSLAERRWLLDCFASEKVWWKTDRWGKPSGKEFGLVPVVIVPGSFDIDTTSEDLISVDFEFEIAHFDKFI